MVYWSSFGNYSVCFLRSIKNIKFLLWLTSSSNKHTVASNMCFPAAQQKPFLCPFSHYWLCAITKLSHCLFSLSKKKEEKRSMLFFFWQKKKKQLYLNSDLLCTPGSPCWRGAPSAGRNCTTAQGTWSRTSWSHLSRSRLWILWSRSDAGWPTRRVSVLKALREDGNS